MLVDSLAALRKRAVSEFCSVMEFKAFTELAYNLSTKHANGLPIGSSFILGYSEFAHSLGLPAKTVTANELPQHFVIAKEVHFLPLVHQHQVVLFESIFFNMLRLLLADQPMRLPSKRQVDYSVILAAQSKDEIVTALIDRELNELKYKSVNEWFVYLQRLVSDCHISETEIGRIAEAKATRDLLVHNSGVVNSIYISKAGQFVRFGIGDQVSVAGHYTRETWQLFSSVLVRVIDSLITIFGPKKANA